MSLFKKDASLSKDYYVFAAIVLAIVLLLCIGFSWSVYRSQVLQREHKLEVVAVRAEQALSGSIHYFEYLMRFLGNQVSQQNAAHDLEYIASLFASLQDDADIKNFSSWSMFDWLTLDYNIRVTSTHGVLEKPVSLAGRGNLPKTLDQPGKLFFNKPTYGKISQQWIVPTAMGVPDSYTGRTVGIINIGVLVDSLREQVEQVVSGEDGVRFMLVRAQDFSVVFSSTGRKDVGTPGALFNEAFSGIDLEKKQVGVLPEAVAYDGVEYAYYKRSSRYPFVMLFGYSKGYVDSTLFSRIIGPIIALAVIGIIFLLLLYIMRKRTIIPIMELADAADSLARGEKVVEIPVGKAHEVEVLGGQLCKVRDLIVDERKAREEIAEKTKQLEKRAQELELAKIEIESSHAQLERRTEQLEALKEEAMIARDMAERANRGKSEFLANMSHELRTPLFTINGYSEAIKNQVYGEVAEHYIEVAENIHAAGSHLLSLINDILDLSKAEAGKMELEESTIDVGRNLGRCVQFVRQMAQRAGVVVQSDFSEDLPLLYVDELKFRQIMLNLLSNAIKFTPVGGQVTVSCRMDGDLYIVVQDTGVGVADEDKEKILSQFGQVKSSLTRRENQGTGLGLPLVRKLVALHGGEFFFESTLGDGTKVTITFPASRLMQQEEFLGEV